MPRSPLLFEFAANNVRLEFFGPTEPATGALATATTQAGSLLLDVPGGGSATSRWRRPDGQLLPGDGFEGPRLYEGTAYDVVVEALDGGSVQLVHRDPRLVRPVTAPSHHEELGLGQINFQRQLGLSRFDILVDGEVRAGFTVQLFPSKLDYDDDYVRILADVTALSRALGLEYLRATFRGGSAEAVEAPTQLDFADLLRQQVDELDRALRYIGDHPSRRLVREIRHVRVDRIRRHSRLTLAAIRQRRGQGSWTTLPGVGPVRAALPVVTAEETLDTSEHRWLKRALLDARRRLAPIVAGVRAEIAHAESRGWSTLRLEAELQELELVESRLARFLRSEIFEAARGEPPSSFSSLTLMGQPGYREAYRALITLRLGLVLDGDVLELTVKDLDQLYEFWCFIRVAVFIAREMGGVVADLSSMFDVSSRGLRVRLVEGQEIHLTSPSGTVVRVAYNESFDGMTGGQKPDVLVEVRRPGWPPIVVIFDAKYRLDASPRYIERFGAPGPPVDAINQLHRYRDALIVAAAGPNHGRPVVKGVALFPSAETKADFQSTQLFLALDALGIGALPFLPTNEDLVTEWLKETLGVPSGVLAEPGPPFLGYEERGHRRADARERVLVVERSFRDAQSTSGGATMDEGLSAAAVQPFDFVALIVKKPAAATSSVVAMARVVRREFPDPSSTEARLHVDEWTSLARQLSGNAASYPLVTSALALRLADKESELGLCTYDEWELVEAVRDRGLAYDTTFETPLDPLQPRSQVVVHTDAGAVVVRYCAAAGWRVERTGQPPEDHATVDSVLSAL